MKCPKCGSGIFKNSFHAVDGLECHVCHLQGQMGIDNETKEMMFCITEGEFKNVEPITPEQQEEIRQLVKEVISEPGKLFTFEEKGGRASEPAKQNRGETGGASEDNTIRI